MTTRTSPRFSSARATLVVVLTLAAVAAAAWGVSATIERRVLGDLASRQKAALDFHVASLEGFLDKYRILPPLIARHPDVIDGFGPDEAMKDAARATRIVDTVAGMTGAEDVRFLTPDGRTLAGSGVRTEGAEFAGVADAPFFRAALEGRLGRALLVLPSERRHSSYLFAAPVRDGVAVVGVVVVQVSLEPVERAWALSKDPVVVTDGAGRIVLTNRPVWRGRLLSDVETPMSGIAGFRPFTRGARPAAQSGEAESNGVVQDRSEPVLWRLPDEDGRTKRYLEAAAFLPLYGWTLHIYADTALAVVEAANAFLLTVLIGLVVTGVVWLFVERRRRLVRQIRLDRATALRLERRVRDRTRDLTAANERLAAEIGERQAAEEQLRRAQADLVQAAKLAALGQMSAALSHEFNQPLAAIRSYADNSVLLLDRDRTDEARANLGRIARLVDRLAELSKHLKTFARKPGTTSRPVRVATVLDEALMLLSPKLKRGSVPVEVRNGAEDLVVEAGQVRLEQVIMNLVANAVDAVAGVEDPRVVVSIERDGDEGVIAVADNGPGIAEDNLARIFDPFFSTKDVGEGLGLGLAIADKIVRDFGGTLQAENGAAGGARFTVRLPLAHEAQAAAE